MKNILFLFFTISIFYFNCKNVSQTSEKKENEISISTEKSVTKSSEEKPKSTNSNNSKTETTMPSEEDGIDFWTANDCVRSIPKPTVPKDKRPEYYSFEINKRQGFGKEVLELENGYKLDITSKGCESIVLTYSYFMYAKDLDIQDPKAVSEKVLELLEMTSKISSPPINIKNKIPALRGAVEQIGPFQIGQEFILADNEIKENFILERLEEKNGKVFLSYYFSVGPL